MEVQLDKSLDWSIVEVFNQRINVQLYFREPRHISTRDMDRLRLTFLDKTFFFDMYGQQIGENDILECYVPAQLVEEWERDVFEFIEAFFDLQLIENETANKPIEIYLALLLQRIFFVVEISHIIIYLPLVYTNYPAPAQFFFEYLLRVAAKEMVDTEGISEAVWSEDSRLFEPRKDADDDVRVQNFEKLGLNGIYFLVNTASALVVFAFNAIGLLLLCALVHFSKCRRCKFVYTHRQSLYGRVFWNLPLEAINESYSLLAICSILNLYFLSWTDFAVSVNSLVSLISFIVLCLHPIVLQLYLRWNDVNLHKSSFKKKFGSSYADLALSSGRYVVYPLLVYYRRLTIPVCLVLFPQNFLVQFLWLLIVNSAMLAVLNIKRPYEDLRKNRSVVAEEAAFFVLNYLTLVLAGWVDDSQVIEGAGYLLVVIPLTFIVLYYIAYIVHQICQLRTFCKRKLFVRRALKDPLKHKNEAKYGSWAK